MRMGMGYRVDTGFIRFSPPQSGSLLQWLDNKWTPLGYFDKQVEVNVVSTITLTTEYQCVFDGSIIPASPLDAAEGIFGYLVGAGDDFSLFSNNIDELKVIGNGVPSTVVYTGINDVESEVQVYKKLGALKVVVDGVEVAELTGLSYIQTTITNYTVGKKNLNIGVIVNYTGFMRYYGICGKRYYPNQTYPEVTVTDPNGTYNKYEYSPDLSDNDNYGLKDTVPVTVPIAEADRAVFTNDGTDFIDVGRPPWLDKLRPSIDEFTIKQTFIADELAFNTLVNLGNVGNTEQINIITRNSGVELATVIGGAVTTIPYGYTVGTVYEIVVSVGLISASVFMNRVLVSDSVNVGSDLNLTDNLYISEGNSPRIFEGKQWDSEFYEGVTLDGDCSNLTPIEKFPLIKETDPTKVTGTVQGTIGTITDGSPLDVWINGITYPINLNSTDNADLLAKGILNQYSTRAQIDALHDGETIFTRPVEGDVTPTTAQGLDIIYETGTILGASEKDTNNIHVGRSLIAGDVMTQGGDEVTQGEDLIIQE